MSNWCRSAASLVRLDLPEAEAQRGRLATGVVYVDSFGNLRLAGGVADLHAALGAIEPGTALLVDYSAARGGFNALAASETGGTPEASRRGDRCSIRSSAYAA